MLSQAEVSSKTNEAKASLEFLKTLVLTGQVIVGDAIFCQKEVCEKIIEEESDYFFIVKENQPTLLKNIRLAFAETAVFSPLDRP